MESTRQHILERIADGPISGPDLANELNISRAAIWKHVDALRAEGIEIESGPHGYVLATIPEYGGPAVALQIPGEFGVEYADSLPSTNDRARELAQGGAEEMVVLANEQPAGRGRLGREWVGPPGGIYLSILVRPNLATVDVPILTIAAGVAVAEALEGLGFEPAIKWPNDVLIDDKKVAGILTEMEGEADRVDWVIVGIGLNANVDSDSLPEGATSLCVGRENPVDRREVVHTILRSFNRYRNDPVATVTAWRERSATLGRSVRVETPRETITGRAVDIEHPGTLLLETTSGIKRVHAGDCEHLRDDCSA